MPGCRCWTRLTREPRASFINVGRLIGRAYHPGKDERSLIAAAPGDGDNWGGEGRGQIDRLRVNEIFFKYFRVPAQRYAPLDIICSQLPKRKLGTGQDKIYTCSNLFSRIHFFLSFFSFSCFGIEMDERADHFLRAITLASRNLYHGGRWISCTKSR